MLELHGHDAALMAVAKGYLRDLADTWLARAKLVIAAGAGLEKAEDVATGDAVRLVAALYDKLTAAGLIWQPATALLNALKVQDTGHALRGEPKPLTAVAMLDAMLSTIQCTSILDGHSAQVVTWGPNLPADLYARAVQLSKQAVCTAAAPALQKPEGQHVE